MEKKDYIVPTIEAIGYNAMLLELSKNDEEGDGYQLGRRRGRRSDWDFEDEEDYEYYYEEDWL